MKRIKKIALLSLLLVLVLPAVSAFASDKIGGFNTYRGIEYEKTEEDLAKLEQILIEDGYMKVSPDTEAWQIFKNSDINANAFSGVGYIDEWTYDNLRDYLYILPADLKTWQDTGKLTDLKYNSVIVGYPRDTNIELADYINDTIPEGVNYGYLTIKAKVDIANVTKVTVKMYNDTHLAYSYINLTKDLDDFTTTVRLPLGLFKVDSVSCYDASGNTVNPPVCFYEHLNKAAAGVSLSDNNYVMFYVGIGTDDIPLPSWVEGGCKLEDIPGYAMPDTDTPASGTTGAATTAPAKPDDTDPIIIPQEDIRKLTNVEYPEEHKWLTPVLILVPLGLIAAGVAIYLLSRNRKKNDTF